jgi:perosamine synthetase
MQAAIGISQMEKLDRIIQKKKLIHDRYVNELKDVKDLVPQKFNKLTSPVHWFTSFLTSQKRELSEYLLQNNIQTREFFYPLNLQPCYNIDDTTSYKNSIELFNRGISLPSSYNLTDTQQDYIIKCIKKFYKK